MTSRRSHHAANTPALAGAPTEREKYAPSIPHCRPRMKARPQMTRAEPMIRIPACRSASPKKRNTRSDPTSPNTRAANLTMSPSAPSQLTGACRRFPTSRWRYFVGNGVTPRLGVLRPRRFAQQRVRPEQRGADRHNLRAGLAGLVPDHLGGGALVERVALHQHALRSLDERPAGDRRLELDRLVETPEGDVDGSFQSIGRERAG